MGVRYVTADEMRSELKRRQKVQEAAGRASVSATSGLVAAVRTEYPVALLVEDADICAIEEFIVRTLCVRNGLTESPGKCV